MDWSSWFRRTLLKDANDPKISDPPKPSSKKKRHQTDEDLEQHGITQPLVDLVKTFTVDTFKNFHTTVDNDDGVAGADSGTARTASACSVRKDLSEWQERHAFLVLTSVKEMLQLRYMLCPRHMKERQFWQIYFVLVKSHIAEYEQRAIQLAKLKEMRMGVDKSSDSSSYEVEMAESKGASSSPPASP
ncbi:hypothetical protein EUGRSUZ_K02168 [Eucalyptus grandis]|uniref:Uncharacterized protein n=2 Tax=Eucalyptus grandis TaxID=71139 RepID=A0ACC3IVH7_EUCGR|nr:hypothetical protein EUGRSUZ_K02168 [Eucalyptus grandis]